MAASSGSAWKLKWTGGVVLRRNIRKTQWTHSLVRPLAKWTPSSPPPPPPHLARPRAKWTSSSPPPLPPPPGNFCADRIRIRKSYNKAFCKDKGNTLWRPWRAGWIEYLCGHKTGATPGVHPSSCTLKYLYLHHLHLAGRFPSYKVHFCCHVLPWVLASSC